MDNNINSYYGENIEELTQTISNDTMGQLQDIDMLDFYMTVSSTNFVGLRSKLGRFAHQSENDEY